MSVDKRLIPERTPMTEETNPAENEPNGSGQSAPRWLLATVDDLSGLDLDTPIADSNTADFHEASDAYRAAAESVENPTDSAAGRVFLMLSALLLIRLTPETSNEPFAPMAIFNDSRSAIPSDFRAHITILAAMADCGKSPILRARLSDICWLLDRKRSQLGRAAIAAYIEIVESMDAGRLRRRFDTEAIDALNREASVYLRRALQIGRAVGSEKPESIAARNLTKRLRERAFRSSKRVPAGWFCDLDFDFSISDPATIGQEIEALLASMPKDSDFDVRAALWRRAARAYRFAKRDQDKNRCLAEAAEQLVAKSETQGSAMVIAQFLADAISQLHGLPGKRDRRKELQHRLVDVQARIPDEMSPFSQRINLQEVAESVEKAIDKHDLVDILFTFAILGESPDPAELATKAAETIRAYPLASIFGASHLDREGKCISRTEGGGFGDDEDSSAVGAQIAQDESIRRLHCAYGVLETARRILVARHYISDDLFEAILRNSPFVRPDQVSTFARGVVRFFQGDRVAALYILTPLLESSLRHVLKAHGHDVTTFDAATQTQEDRMIGPLFKDMRSELETIFGVPIVGDLERVFLGKPGPSIRNAVAHGLMQDGDPYGADAIYACWLIYTLAMRPLYPYREQLRRLLQDF